MNPIFLSEQSPNIEFMARDGDRYQTISIPYLASLLACSPERLQAILLVLLRGGSEESVMPVDKLVDESALGVRGNVRSLSVRSETSLYKNIYLSERFVAPGDNSKFSNIKELARMLAIALDDIGSLGGYEKLVREHPLPLLQEALRRVERIPQEKITKSRGAVFTGIVRKLTAVKATFSSTDTTPYA